jgi:hypothetical protein
MCVMLMLKGSSQAWHATFLIPRTRVDRVMGPGGGTSGGPPSL